MPHSAIGRPTPLLEGHAKVTGEIRYATDHALTGMLHARLVTSLYAHATLRDIDTSQALAQPGVVAVLTANDLPNIPPSSRSRLLLARGRVIFAGQPVAMVLATSEAAAHDAVQFVQVDYDPLPAAATLDAALAEDAPLVWPDGIPTAEGDAGAHGAEAAGEHTTTRKHPNIAEEETFTRGDVRAALASAHTVVEGTFNTPMVHQSPLETQAVVVQPNAVTGGATVWASTQAPFSIREAVAEALDLDESDVRVIGTPPGGAFGSKFNLYEPLVALAARAVKRPIRLALTRSEEMLSANPAPAIRIHARLGFDREGTLAALEAEVLVDDGCYPFGVAGFFANMLASFYRVPNFAVRGVDVLTFKPSAGAYRAPGAPSIVFALESLMDEAARALKLDPLELRLRNAARPGDPMADGKPWPGMGMREVLEALRDHPAWQKRDEARAQGRGVGFAIGGWPGGLQPAAAMCGLNRDGLIHIHVGAVDLNGTHTSMALLAAEAFGVAPEKVRLHFGDTDSAPFAGGAGGSKIIYTVGAAVVEAAREARRQTFAIAADELEVAAEDLEIVDGKVQVRGVPSQAIPLGDLAAKTMQFGGKYPPVVAQGRSAQTTASPGFCAQLAEVEVDAETGAVAVHRLVVVQDVGRAINPLAVEGQMFGGATQGLGWALYENLNYDEGGQLLSGTWLDYNIPHSTQAAARMESVIVEVPSQFGPFGARGVGEPPIVPTAAAVANAIADATGVRLRDLPITAPRLVAALHA